MIQKILKEKNKSRIVSGFCYHKISTGENTVW